MAEMSEDRWRPARLIPIAGTSSPTDQEVRGCSVLLAVMKAVKEFGAALLSDFGAPAGRLETYVEVPFTLNGRHLRPDGLVRTTRGSKTWTALLEVKTGKNCLRVDQVEAYLDIAREHGFDAVITISNEIKPAPKVHPLKVSLQKLNKVSMYHLSWARIHTEALLERDNKLVADPDQAWILEEFIRYLHDRKSGATEFESMGSSWVPVRRAVIAHTIKPSDPALLEVATRADQLITHAGMVLSRNTGVYVRPALTRKDLNNPDARLRKQVQDLATTGRITAGLEVPGTVSPARITIDVATSMIQCSATVQAPGKGRPQTRVSWLLRQLENAPPDVQVETVVKNARSAGPCASLKAASQDPTRLLSDAKGEIRAFEVSWARKAGTKQGSGRGSLPQSVIDAVQLFYERVLQNLKSWHPSPPKVKTEQPPLDEPSIGDPYDGAEAGGDVPETTSAPPEPFIP